MMETPTHRTLRLSAVFAGLTDRRRRRTLALLRTRDRSISEADLAAHLGADERGCSPEAVSGTALEDVLASLRHRHLPTLDDAGLVERDLAAKTVRDAGHPALEQRPLQRLVDWSIADDAPHVDSIFDALACDRRRSMLSILEGAVEPVSHRRLAERVVDRESDRASGSVEEAAVDGVLATFHHVHIPKLQAAGLIESDADDRLTYGEHPIVDPSWFEVGTRPDSRRPSSQRTSR